ncbi:MAG: GAF domain-containing protein [Anaerolineae bacterium]|nr:GAF domain-containing protein [Anaerolineae bacterium]
MQNTANTQANLPIWQQLRWRLTLYFVLLTVGVIAIITGFTLLQLRNQSTQQTFRQLESVAQLKQNQIARWLETGDLLLHAALSDPNTQTRVLNVLTFESTLPTAQSSLNASLAASVNAQSNLSDVNTLTFDEIFVYNVDGRIILASNRSVLNRIVTLQPYFQPSLQGEFITPPYYDVGTNDLTAFITHPIRAINGTVIGVVAGRLNMEVLRSITAERAGLGETGETYLVSIESNYFLTPSRLENFTLTRAYHSEGIDQALAGVDGSGIYPNYADPPTPVLGVYRWIPELGAGLLAEITEAEANTLVTQTSLVIIGLVGVLALGAGLVGLFAATNISRPVVALTQIAQQIAGGDLSQRASINQRNEIGKLADSFNVMTDQLDDLIGSLETRIADRTRDLQAVADVNAQVSTILQLDPLLQEVADLTKSRLNLYHAHIYLLDEAENKLVLVAGADEIGRQMVAEKRVIGMDNQQSIVANAARGRRGVIINDVTASPTFLPHRLLPNTRSEMAMPLISRGQLLGVLDVQSDKKEFFNAEMFSVIELMSGQVATAISNASAFENVERSQTEVSRRAAELETVAKVSALTTRILDVEEILQTVSDLTKESFDLYHAHVYLLDEVGENLVLAAGAGEIGRLMKSQGRKIAVNNPNSLVARAARSRKGVIANNITNEPDFLPNPLLPETQSEMAIPMVVGEQVIGVLDVQASIINRFTHEDVRVQTTLADQIAVAVQNARAFTQVLLYADTVNNSPIGMNVWRLEDINDTSSLRLMIANPATEAITRINPETLIGKRFFDAYPTADSQLPEIYANVVRTGQSVDLGEIDFTSDPGTPTIFTVKAFPLPNNSVGISFEDITRRKLQEQAVMELNTRFQDISSTLPGAIFQFSAHNGVWATPYMSQGIYDIIGVPAEAIREDLNRFTERIHPDDIQRYTASIVKVLETFETWHFEGRSIKPSGELVWWEAFSQPSKLASGEIVFNGVVFDISERKRQEELIQLRAVEIQTVATVGSSIATNLDYDQLLWSVANLTRDNFNRYHVNIYLLDETGENLTLAAASGNVGRELVKNAHQIPLNAAKSLVARAARDREPVVIQNVNQQPDFLRNPLLPNTQAEMALPIIYDKHVFGVLDIQDDKTDAFEEAQVQAKLILTNQIAVAIQNARTFTVRIESEKAVRESEQRYQQILDGVGDMILVKGEKSRIVWANKSFREYYGMTVDSLQGMIDAPFAEPDFTQQYIRDDHYVWENGIPLTVPEEPVTRHDGTVRLFETYKAPIFDPTGNVFLTVGVSRDITQRKQQEEEQTILYNVASKLTNAQDASDIMESLAEYGVVRGAINGTLLRIDNDENGQPAWAEIVANWNEERAVGTPVGSRFYLPNFPFSRLWLSTPNTPILVNDIQEDPRIDAGTRAIYQQAQTTSAAILPLYTQGRWVGLVTFSWSGATYFNEQDERILSAIQRQVTPTMDALYASQAMRKRAAELQTVAEVSAATTTQLEVDELLQSVVDLVKLRFDLYHAHAYLLDSRGENLVLAAGAGEAGQIMKAEGRRIPLSHTNSLVARAARQGQGVISNDVTHEPDFLPNPLLPDTQSELSVPMIVGGQLIGVLDVQADKVNHFTDEDVRVQTALADQIAVAVQNARAFMITQQRARNAQIRNQVSDILRSSNDVEKSIEEVMILMAETLGFDNLVMSSFDHKTQMWHGYVGAGKGMTSAIAKTFVDPAPAYPHGMEVINTGRVVIIDDVNQYPNFPEYYIETLGIRSVLTLPVIIENRVSAVIFGNFSQQMHVFTEEDIALGQILSEQISIGIERKTQEDEQQLLYLISAQLTNARTSQEILNAMTEYGRIRGGSSGTLLTIESENNQPNWAEVVANWQNDGSESTTPVGSRFYLPEFPISGLWLSNPGRPILIDDVLTDERVDSVTRMAYQATNARGTVIVPLYTQGRWIGLVTLNWSDGVRFTEQDERILSAIMLQVIPTLDALQASLQMQKRAAELQTVADVSKTAAATLDANKLLSDVSELTKSSFGLYHAHIYLLDEDGEHLMLAAGAGNPGRIMRERGHSIRLEQITSLVATAARSGETVIINDVAQVPNYLPNPLLPETRSEMSVPMIVGDKLIGVLDVQAATVNRFTETDALVMRTLADQVAVAVENARAFQIQQETAERLREVDRLKSQFLANMSHELRTPLNSIIGYAEVLLDGIDGDLSADAIEDVEAIHGGGKHLLTIINDILDLAKIEAGQMFIDRRETDVMPVIDEVMNTVKILAANKGIDLDVDIEDNFPKVYGDPIRIKQIVLNLMTNSIKFTENGRVTLRMFRHNDGEIAVQVQDTGMGMSETDIQGLFQQFHQVDGSATRRAGGTGLGLVITRHLVHMHEGEIYVESEKGVGSTFWFTIPTYAEQMGQKA